MLLAICNEIGEASYDKIRVAKHMCTVLNNIYTTNPYYVDMQTIESRYKIPFHTMTSESIFNHICENYCQSDEISAANKLLGDYRKGLLGYNSLEILQHPVGSIHANSTPGL